MPIDFKIIDDTVPYNQAGLRKSFCCKLNSKAMNTSYILTLVKLLPSK